MSVTVLEVMAAARTRAASLVAEVAGYLVLAAADQVVGAPRALAARSIALGQDGVLRLIERLHRDASRALINDVRALFFRPSCLEGV